MTHPPPHLGKECMELANEGVVGMAPPPAAVHRRPPPATAAAARRRKNFFFEIVHSFEGLVGTRSS